MVKQKNQGLEKTFILTCSKCDLHVKVKNDKKDADDKKDKHEDDNIGHRVSIETTISG